MTGHRSWARLFEPVPGSRPAALAGLTNGVAVGFPLLVGVAAGDPAAGALACLGAYVAAFTNKGGLAGSGPRAWLWPAPSTRSLSGPGNW